MYGAVNRIVSISIYGVVNSMWVVVNTIVSNSVYGVLWLLVWYGVNSIVSISMQ